MINKIHLEILLTLTCQLSRRPPLTETNMNTFPMDKFHDTPGPQLYFSILQTSIQQQMVRMVEAPEKIQMHIVVAMSSSIIPCFSKIKYLELEMLLGFAGSFCNSKVML